MFARVLNVVKYIVVGILYRFLKTVSFNDGVQDLTGQSIFIILPQQNVKQWIIIMRLSRTLRLDLN